MKLQIYGRQEIDQELDEDKDLSIAFLLTRIKKVEKDKSDDSITYKVENIGEVVIKQEDKVIKAVDKDKFKQRLRGAMHYIHEDNGVTTDFEIWREVFKNKIIAYLPEIYEYLKNKN